jgi:hypothetical protein
LLNRSPQCGSTIFDLVLSFVSPKDEGWMKTFFVVVLMTGSSLKEYSNCFVISGEEPSPISGSFSFGTLKDHLVVGFLGGIIPATKIKFQRLCKTKTKKRIKTYELQPANLQTRIHTSKAY